MKKIQKILNEVVDDMLVKHKTIYEFGDVSAETTPQETYRPPSTAAAATTASANPQAEMPNSPYIQQNPDGVNYSRLGLGNLLGGDLASSQPVDHPDDRLAPIGDISMHAGRSLKDVSRAIQNNYGNPIAGGLGKEHVQEIAYHANNYKNLNSGMNTIQQQLQYVNSKIAAGSDGSMAPNELAKFQQMKTALEGKRADFQKQLQVSDAALRKYNFDVQKGVFHNGLGGVNGPNDITPMKSPSGGSSGGNVSFGNQSFGNETQSSSNNSSWGNGFTPGRVSAPHIGGILDQFSRNPGVSTLTAPNGVDITREGANNIHAAIGSIPQIENQMEDLQRQANMHKSTIMRIQGGGEGTYQDMMNAQKKLQEIGEQHASLQQQLAGHQKTLSDYGIDRRGNFIPQQKSAFQNNPLLVGGLAAGGLVGAAAGINALMNRRKKQQ